jgi:hypothetical protein
MKLDKGALVSEIALREAIKLLLTEHVNQANVGKIEGSDGDSFAVSGVSANDLLSSIVKGGGTGYGQIFEEIITAILNEYYNKNASDLNPSANSTESDQTGNAEFADIIIGTNKVEGLDAKKIKDYPLISAKSNATPKKFVGKGEPSKLRQLIGNRLLKGSKTLSNAYEFIDVKAGASYVALNIKESEQQRKLVYDVQIAIPKLPNLRFANLKPDTSLAPTLPAQDTALKQLKNYVFTNYKNTIQLKSVFPDPSYRKSWQKLLGLISLVKYDKSKLSGRAINPKSDTIKNDAQFMLGLGSLLTNPLSPNSWPDFVSNDEVTKLIKSASSVDKIYEMLRTAAAKMLYGKAQEFKAALETRTNNRKATAKSNKSFKYVKYAEKKMLSQLEKIYSDKTLPDRKVLAQALIYFVGLANQRAKKSPAEGMAAPRVDMNLAGQYKKEKLKDWIATAEVFVIAKNKVITNVTKKKVSNFDSFVQELMFAEYEYIYFTITIDVIAGVDKLPDNIVQQLQDYYGSLLSNLFKHFRKVDVQGVGDTSATYPAGIPDYGNTHAGVAPPGFTPQELDDAITSVENSTNIVRTTLVEADLPNETRKLQRITTALTMLIGTDFELDTKIHLNIMKNIEKYINESVNDQYRLLEILYAYSSALLDFNDNLKMMLKNTISRSDVSSYANETIETLISILSEVPQFDRIYREFSDLNKIGHSELDIEPTSTDVISARINENTLAAIISELLLSKYTK